LYYGENTITGLEWLLLGGWVFTRKDYGENMVTNWTKGK
jgi:hypothetical protein